MPDLRFFLADGTYLGKAGDAHMATDVSAHADSGALPRTDVSAHADSNLRIREQTAALALKALLKLEVPRSRAKALIHRALETQPDLCEAGELVRTALAYS